MYVLSCALLFNDQDFFYHALFKLKPFCVTNSLKRFGVYDATDSNIVA